jgi:glycine cleavage system transcriptional repressor
MTRLSNEFAMIFLFSGRGENLEDQLARACRRLEREKGISAFFRPVETPLTPPQTRVSTHTMHVEGVDHAGIVYHVSKYLATHQINIIDLSSCLRFSPESGTAMYAITLHIEIPEETAMDDLEKGLLELGDELDVDITMPQ